MSLLLHATTFWNVQSGPSTEYETIRVEFKKVCWMRQTYTVKMDTCPSWKLLVGKWDSVF